MAGDGDGGDFLERRHAEGFLRGACQRGAAHPPFSRHRRRGTFYGAPSFPSGKCPRKEREGKPWRLFTAEEVHHFSDALGDHNAIHQGSQPIVSGFQLLVSLAAMYPGKAIRLRFHHPVRAGEMVYLKKEGDQLLGYTDTLCFAGEWQRKGSRE